MFERVRNATWVVFKWEMFERVRNATWVIFGWEMFERVRNATWVIVRRGAKCHLGSVRYGSEMAVVYPQIADLSNVSVDRVLRTVPTFLANSNISLILNRCSTAAYRLIVSIIRILGSPKKQSWRI